MTTVRFILLALTLSLGLVQAHVGIPIVDALNQTCGRTRLRGGTIVGGIVAGEGEFPWLVSLQIQRPDGFRRSFCGAVIISDRWLLTAAHCFKKIKQQNALHMVTAIVGTNNVVDGSGDRYELEQAIVHPHFEMTNFLNDITLLRTKNPIIFRKTGTNYKVNSVCLPPYNTNRVPFPPKTAVVSGWGATESGLDVYPARLLKVTVSLIDHDECSNTYKTVHNLLMSNKTLCYGKNHKDSCQGDSGGPLVIIIGGRTTSIGIVSFGAGCGTYPGVYTNVVDYRDWIAANIY